MYEGGRENEVKGKWNKITKYGDIDSGKKKVKIQGEKKGKHMEVE